MNTPLPIKIALANLNDNINADEIYQFLESNSKDIEAYQLDNSKVSAAAIDYIAILSAIGSVASIGALFWMAYEKFIVPKKQPSSDGGLYIVIHLSKKERIEFWIGNTYKEKETFIKEFTYRVNEFRQTDKAKKEYDEVIKEFSTTDKWIKRK